MELYTAFDEKRKANLPEMEIQYADYALWQRKYLQGDILDRKIDYWKKKNGRSSSAAADRQITSDHRFRVREEPLQHSKL